VLTQNALNNLILRLIIKNIVLTSVAELQQIKELCKNIMRKKQLKRVPLGFAKNASRNLAGTILMTFVLLAQKKRTQSQTNYYRV
jgi:hypothetical protein